MPDITTVRLEKVPVIPTAAYPSQVIFQVSFVDGKPILSCYVSFIGVVGTDKLTQVSGQTGSLSVEDVAKVDPAFAESLLAFMSALNATGKAL